MRFLLDDFHKETMAFDLVHSCNETGILAVSRQNWSRRENKLKMQSGQDGCGKGRNVIKLMQISWVPYRPMVIVTA